MFNWRTHETKTFDEIELKSQPHTPEIQRLSLSLIKPFLLGQRNCHFYQNSENVLVIIKPAFLNLPSLVHNVRSINSHSLQHFKSRYLKCSFENVTLKIMLVLIAHYYRFSDNAFITNTCHAIYREFLKYNNLNFSIVNEKFGFFPFLL